MPLGLEGKHAVVCGATQGIGLAAAQHLAGLGARVTLMARNAERLEEARHSLVGHLPVNDAVFVDLLDDGFCHKKAGTYTKRLRGAAPPDPAGVSDTARMMPR